MTTLEIYKKVKDIKDKYGTNNPFDICSAEDILVYYSALPNSVDGFLHYDDEYDTYMVCINSSLEDEKRVLTLAHELGHFYTHCDKHTTYLRQNNTLHLDSGYEYEADVFASELLIDDDIFDKYYGHSNSYIACCERVSEDFLSLKEKKIRRGY